MGPDSDRSAFSKTHQTTVAVNPKNFFAELRRRNVSKVAIAYAVIAWLLIQAGSILFPTFEAPGWVMKALVTVIAAGFPIALVLAWAFELTPEGIKRTEDLDVGKSIARRTGRKLTGIIIAVAFVALGLFLFQLVGIGHRGTQSDAEPGERQSVTAVPANERSIAVLPFVNMSSDQENPYFVDGLTEEILNRLAQIKALKVPGHTSSFAFKNQNRNLRQIGAALGVAHALEGSVRKSGERLRITAQLVRTSDGYHLWSQVYDRKLDDVFAIQEEIARAIAQALSVQLKLGGEGKHERPTQDMAAYGNYLEARALITQRTADNLRRATALLEAAVQRDPGFAKAWAALAQARALGFYYLVMPMKQSLEGAESAARKALIIDDSLGVAHSALADVLRDRYDWLGAEAEYRRALELSPGEAETHNQYSQMLLRVGHLDAALEHANRACELDPLAWVPPSVAALIQLSRGDLAQSRLWLDRFEKARGKIDGFAIRVELIHALSGRNMDLARRTLALARSSPAPELSSPADKKLIDAMDQALASTGNGSAPPPNLVRALEEAEAMGELHIAPQFSTVAIFVNQPEVALDALWFDMRSPGGLDCAWIWTPPLQPVRNEPRFLDLLRAMKLPEYWRVAGWEDSWRFLPAKSRE
jgi:TolB-like protein/Tfp pilus assembly protein PilF